MGKCQSTNKSETRAVVSTPNEMGIADKEAAVNKEGIAPSRSEAPRHTLKEIIITVKDASTDKIIMTRTFPSGTRIKTVADSIKDSILPNGEYEFVHNSVSVSTFSHETIATVFPKQDKIDLVLKFAGLDIPKDALRAYNESTHIIGSPKFESDPFEIVLYDISTSNLSYFLYKSMEISDLKRFDYFSSYCNAKDKLYISGGDKGPNDETYHQNFIEIDLKKIHKKENHMRKLPNLITGRGWHSMIHVPNNYIFIVGGINTKTVEVYDMKTDKITVDSVLNENRSEATLCLVNNSELYAFCGFLIHNNFHSSIEKCNLLTKNRKWEIVNINLADNKIPFEPSFFSVSFYKDDQILLLGCNEMSQIKQSENTNNKQVKNYIFTPGSNNSGTIKLFEASPLQDLCSEKFFLPINNKTSILMPMYASDSVKVLFVNDGLLEVTKFEEMMQEQTIDDITTAFAEKRLSLNEEQA